MAMACRNGFACCAAFMLAFAVMLWSVQVISTYIFHAVHSWGGPTPMALDTALCMLGLSVAVMIVSGWRVGGQ